MWGRGEIIKRKIIQHGPSTLVVSLPAIWAKKYGLNKGDELELLEEGKVLRISTHKSTASRKIEIDLSGTGILTNRIIKKVYQHGYDSACFRFNTPEQLKRIRDVSTELIGFEPVEHGAEYCILKDFSGSHEEDFNILFRRLFLLAKMLAADVSLAVEKQDAQMLQSLALRELDINKLANFCIRRLNKGDVDDVVTNSKNHLVIYFLESSCDVYKEVIQDLLKANAKAGKRLQGLFKDFSVLVTQVYETTFSKDIKIAIQAGALYERLKQQIQDEPQDSYELQLALKLKSLLQLVIPIIELQLLDFKNIIAHHNESC
jgi:phosphate uptake regulator